MALGETYGGTNGQAGRRTVVRREPGLEVRALELSYKNMKGYSTKASVRNPNAAPLLWKPIPERTIHNPKKQRALDRESAGANMWRFVQWPETETART